MSSPFQTPRVPSAYNFLAIVRTNATAAQLLRMRQRMLLKQVISVKTKSRKDIKRNEQGNVPKGELTTLNRVSTCWRMATEGCGNLHPLVVLL